MIELLLVLGFFTGMLVGRLVNLFSRAGEFSAVGMKSITQSVLTILSSISFLAIFGLGFAVFRWWIWLGVVMALSVLANIGIQGNNMDSGKRLIPIFHLTTIAACTSAYVLWLQIS